MSIPINKLDLIGIGALNLDFIASREKVLDLEPDMIPELNSRFEHGTEIKVSDKDIDQTLAQMGAISFETFLGGSAINTIHSIAHTSRTANLGYIGIAGDAYPHDHGFIEEMELLGVDTQFVSRSDTSAGRCVSYISNGERTLLTTPGSNIEMASFLESNFEQIINYIATAKMLHLTSFFDNDTPRVLAKILLEAKNRNPWLKISFDPGCEWAKNLTEPIKAIFKLSDFVILNNHEFQMLGNYSPGKIDSHIAREIFQLCGQTSVLIVLKRYDSIKLFYKLQGRIVERFFSNKILPFDVIEDATGAGDIFAAGFLSGILVPGLELSHGVALGLRLVRCKLLAAGYSCFDRFSEIFSELINDISSTYPPEQHLAPKTTHKPDIIFIGHGHNTEWIQLEKHLKENLKLPCKSFESEPQAGKHVINILSEMLEACTFAIMVMTAEDETIEQGKRARQNVLHEIGLFQGKLGFNKVILLCQRGVEKFSNVDGLQHLEFEGSNIEKSFHDLDNVLRREHLLK